MGLHCSPSTVGAGGSGVQGHSQLQGEFEASLGYINKMKWEEEACAHVCGLTTYDGQREVARNGKGKQPKP